MTTDTDLFTVEKARARREAARPKYDRAKAAHLMRALPPESWQRQAIAAARRYRGAWLHVGRYLQEIAFGGDYKDWGFSDVYRYAKEVLDIDKAEARRLMSGYMAIKNLCPRLLEAYEEGETDRFGPPDVPDIRTALTMQDLDEKAIDRAGLARLVAEWEIKELEK